MRGVPAARLEPARGVGENGGSRSLQLSRFQWLTVLGGQLGRKGGDISKTTEKNTEALELFLNMETLGTVIWKTIILNIILNIIQFIGIFSVCF